MDLVRRTLSLSNQPNLTEKELAQRAMDWQDALEPEVPLNRLQDAYRAAVRGHTSSFPVNAFEVLAAWRELSSVELADRAARVARENMERERNYRYEPPPEGLLDDLQAMLRRKSFTSVDLDN